MTTIYVLMHDTGCLLDKEETAEDKRKNIGFRISSCCRLWDKDTSLLDSKRI
jgi:hypothetical protein